jgi:hypothetical protein
MYSSFKKQKIITESWRKFIKEEQEISSDEALDLAQQTLQDNPGLAKRMQKINPEELEKILNAIANAPTEVINQITENKNKDYGFLHNLIRGEPSPEETAKSLKFIQDYIIPAGPAGMAFMTVLDFLTTASHFGDIGNVSTGVKLLASAIAAGGAHKLMTIILNSPVPLDPAVAKARKAIRI